MKVLSILAVLVGSALCSLEPTGYRSSSTYLSPSYHRRVSSVYLPPGNRRQNVYSAPQSNYHHQPSYQPDPEYNTAPSSTYLPPNNAHQSTSVTSNSYVPPPPKNTFSMPDVADVRNSQLPATSYGVPEYSSARTRGYRRYNHEDDYSNEPAKYNFAYQVNDNNGNDYGHQESRNGAKTRGFYSVLLPDGRKQLVEYEADEAGYRPKISYENVQTDRAAYPGGGPY